MLKITNLHFDYHDTLFLQGINLSLSAGNVLYLRGKNGVGKTTLLRLIAGIFTADSGSIVIDGISLHQDSVTYREKISFVGHKLGLNPYLTVKETLSLDSQMKDINEVLSEFNFCDLADSRCANLSAGQQRRVALLRPILSQAKLWLLDEPFVALDEQNIQRLALQINKHRQLGGAVVLTSHQTLPIELNNYLEYEL